MGKITSSCASTTKLSEHYHRIIAAQKVEFWAKQHEKTLNTTFILHHLFVENKTSQKTNKNSRPVKHHFDNLQNFRFHRLFFHLQTTASFQLTPPQKVGCGSFHPLVGHSFATVGCQGSSSSASAWVAQETRRDLPRWDRHPWDPWHRLDR